MQSALELHDVEVRLGSPPRIVVQHVSFSLREGEVVAIVGPSGCGKSTLLRTAVGLQASSAGGVRVRGEAVEAPHAGMSIVFQDHELFEWMTVADNVAFGLEARGTPRPERDRKVQEMLALVGLERVGDEYPKSLSGGMRQRGAIARALAVDPPVLLLDEPFGSLDFATRRSLQSEVGAICQRARTTVLLVTHAMDEAIFMADRVLVMEGPPGRIVHEVSVPYARPREHGLRVELSFLQQCADLESRLPQHKPRQEVLP